MKPNPAYRLPAPLETAAQRLKLAIRQAVERSVESLGLAALSAAMVQQRDALLTAQFELNRKSSIFLLAFNEAFDARLVSELTPATASASDTSITAPASWDALSLVDDSEMDAQISADRMGMEIAFGCEWELRELDGYVNALIGDAERPMERNPLRPDLVAHATMRAVPTVSDRVEIRTLLTGEFSRSLAALLPAAYAAMIADLRNAGLQPLALAVRNRASAAGGAPAAADSRSDHPGSGAGNTSGYGAPGAGYAPGGGAGYAQGTGGADAVAEAQRRAADHRSPTHSGAMHTRPGTPLGQVDPELMMLLRRLNQLNRGAAAGQAGGHAGPPYAGDGAAAGGPGGGVAGHYAAYAEEGLFDTGPPSFAPPNLIHAHREELRQVSRGVIDHMVIDVIGFLFDQILADPKVPPQLARQIARLQLPVLRAALGDPNFFASRRHPVRRFVNRIASLGAAFEDFESEEARAFLVKVRDLIQEVVDGEFDQIEVYEQKLAALVSFTVEREREKAQAKGEAAALLAEKEDQLRLRQLYAQQLAGDLKDVPAPDFLRDFISRVWSLVLLRAAQDGGADGTVAQRLRHVGRELFLSVQPKPTTAHRKAFLAGLPRLMQELNEGLNLIAWPDAQRRAFFGELMPAHAESLRRPPGRQLDVNLLARQVEGALGRPLPSNEEVRAATAALPVLTDELVVPSLSAEEARRVGFVEESSVDWDGTVDIELPGDAEAAVPDSEPAAPGLPALAEPPDPTSGQALVGNLQVGFAYRMHLAGDWQKVRLSHVSPGRTFFIFTHGPKQQQTVSMTQRMMLRLAESGRLRAFEEGYLIERATARARRQLAALRAPAA